MNKRMKLVAWLVLRVFYGIYTDILNNQFKYLVGTKDVLEATPQETKFMKCYENLLDQYRENNPMAT